MGALQWLSDIHEFPPVETAMPDGLLAIGGDLDPERLLVAYRHGVFPWFNSDDMILWWSPDPRMVLYPKKIKVSKSMRKIMDSGQFTLTINHCFDKVVAQCAKITRKGQTGTWITPNMQQAYMKLHRSGHAISYEVWQGNRLVGGLYGVDLGRVFCGESMFSKVSNASKFAFIKLAHDLQARQYTFIDCQVYTKHLESLGAEKMPRNRFIALLNEALL